MKKSIKIIRDKFLNWYKKRLTVVEFLQRMLFFIGLVALFMYQARYKFIILDFSDKFHDTLFYICIYCFFLKIVITKEKWTTYLRFLIYILIVYFIGEYLGENDYLILIILPIIAARNIDIKKIVKYIFAINITVLCVRVGLYVLNEFFGLELFDLFVTRYFYRGNLIRHTFYFDHPNTFSNFLFWTFMMYIYLNFDNKEKRNQILLFCIVFFVFVYVFPNSRTASFSFLIVDLLFLLYHNEKVKKNAIFKIFNKHSFLIFMVMSFLLAYLYGQGNVFGDVVSIIDKFFTGRIRIGKAFLSEYGISLFGIVPTTIRNKNVLGHLDPNFIVDNWYYYLIIRNGIIMVIFYIYYFYKTANMQLKNNDYAKLFVIMVFLIYSFSEGIAKGTLMYLSFPLFFLSPYI